jgi:antibiotic biosynthesis monooxygenase (ABM) superfamily enzyme
MSGSANGSYFPSVVTKVRVRAGAHEAFCSWHARLSTTAAGFAGFVNAEVVSPNPPLQEEWLIVQRFASSYSLQSWRESSVRRSILDEARRSIADDEPATLRDVDASTVQLTSSATEVITTRLKPGTDQDYLRWAGDIQHAQARFPGYQGVYLQPPVAGETECWTTLLRFDSHQHLNAWLASTERLRLVLSAEHLIKSEENHQVTAAFAGWFNAGPAACASPAAWQTAMMVLVVLFPLVMLEFRFFNPLVAGWNLSLGTFVGNAISVSLVTWPMVPLVIRCMGWWLTPDRSAPAWLVPAGTALLCGLYAVEIAAFWRFL